MTPAAPPLKRFDGARIVPCKCVLAVYVKVQAGRMTTIVSSNAASPEELKAAVVAAQEAASREMRARAEGARVLR